MSYIILSNQTNYFVWWKALFSSSFFGKILVKNAAIVLGELQKKKKNTKTRSSESHGRSIFKASALWPDAFYKLKCTSVRPCVYPSVCLFTFEVPFKHLFAPTSRSRMSNIFKDSESVGKSNGKKWSHIWTFLFENCEKLPRKTKFFLLILPYKTWWKPRFSMD